MKTNFLQKNRRQEGNRQRINLVIVVFLILFGIFFLFSSEILSGLGPLWNLRNAIIHKGDDLVSFFKFKNSLIEENRLLKDKINAEESLLYSYRSLEDSNNQLLSDLGRLPNEAKLAAGVLVRPPQSMYDVLVIDAGEREGVKVGNQVILPFGPLMGSVTKTTLATSEVTLYSSYGVKTEAIFERGEVPVTLIGIGGGNFEVELPRDINSVVGDRVLSFGISPRLMGIVEDVSAASTDAFKRVIIKSPQSFYSLRFVYVLK